MNKETQSAPGQTPSPGILALLEAKGQEAKAKEQKAIAKQQKAKAKEAEAKARELLAKEEEANALLRDPLVKRLKYSDKQLTITMEKDKTNTETQKPFIKEKLAIDKNLDFCRWKAGRDLFALRATFPVYTRTPKTTYTSDSERVGWTEYLQKLCETEKLAMSPRSAHTYLKAYSTWAGHETLGEAAAEKGLLKQSEIVLAAQNDNPKLAEPKEILRVAEEKITEAKTIATTVNNENRKAFNALKAEYARDGVTVSGAEDKGTVQVWIKDFDASTAPAGHYVNVQMTSDQLRHVKGTITLGIIASAGDAEKFFTACKIEKNPAKGEGAGAGA